MRCKVLILGLALLLLTGCIGGGADTNTLTIEIEGEGRVVGASRRYTPGSIATFRVIPAQGYVFSGWDGDTGGLVGSLREGFELVMDKSHSLTAVFSEAAQSTTLTILYWNIQHGKGNDGVVNLERTAREIVASGADIVVLSELDRNRQRSGRQDQIAELQRLTEFPHAVFHSATSGYEFGSGLWYYGNGVLSKFPVVADQGYPLPNPERGETRKVASVRLQVGMEQVVIYGTHLSVITEERPAQVGEILALARGEDASVILAGDLNARPDSPEVEELVNEWFLDTYPEMNTDPGYTYFGTATPARIDYVFVEKFMQDHLIDVRVMETEASDHYGVLATLLVPQR